MGTVAVIAAMGAEVLQWPVYGLSLLLAPILAVEGCSIGTALLQWLRLVRRQFGRAFIYDARSPSGVGLIITMPLFVPLVTLASLYNFNKIQASIHAIYASQKVLTAMALGPLFAYMAVANVFIYLNLPLTKPAWHGGSNRRSCVGAVLSGPQFGPTKRLRSHSRRTWLSP